jgi:hypothetical protein
MILIYKPKGVYNEKKAKLIGKEAHKDEEDTVFSDFAFSGGGGV